MITFLAGLLCITLIIGAFLFLGLVHYYCTEKSLKGWEWEDLLQGGFYIIVGALVGCVIIILIYSIGEGILLLLK
jgi:hypothetical protein